MSRHPEWVGLATEVVRAQDGEVQIRRRRPARGQWQRESTVSCPSDRAAVISVGELSLARRGGKGALASANSGQATGRVTQPLPMAAEHLENETERLEEVAKAWDSVCTAHVSDEQTCRRVHSPCRTVALPCRLAGKSVGLELLRAGARRPGGTGGTAMWPQCCPSSPRARTGRGLPPGTLGRIPALFNQSLQSSNKTVRDRLLEITRAKAMQMLSCQEPCRAADLCVLSPAARLGPRPHSGAAGRGEGTRRLYGRPSQASPPCRGVLAPW